jgi:hypothetical protein
MPFTANQLVVGANYQLDYFLKNDPIDQINIAHPLYSTMVANKAERLGGNEFVTEQVRFTNDSNFQNYFGADQVTYNEKDTVRQAKFRWYNFHDGFGFDEDTLRANGIILTDDREAVASGAETLQLTNRLKESYETLKLGVQAALDEEFHLDGTQSAKATPGLDHLVSTTPTSGIVGGINSATATWWQNNASMAINTATAGTLIDQMEIQWRACTLYGGMAPDKILCGSKFLDAYRKDAGLTINREIMAAGNQRGGVSLDAGTTKLYFKGVELVWDPQMDLLDAKLGAITYPWAKRCYFLNSRYIKFRPVQGHWMTRRKPPRIYDRYVHYWAMTGSYSMTIGKRNCHSVLSIA